METINIGGLELLNARKGRFWFSPDTLRFFRSRYSDTATKVDDKAYFTSSERGPSGIRKYSVRVCNMETGAIDTVGKFQDFDTRAQAIAELRYVCAKAERAHDES